MRFRYIFMYFRCILCVFDRFVCVLRWILCLIRVPGQARARDPGPQLWTADFKKNASWKKMTCYILSTANTHFPCKYSESGAKCEILKINPGKPLRNHWNKSELHDFSAISKTYGPRSCKMCWKILASQWVRRSAKRKVYLLRGVVV